jgi:cytochrome b561
MSASTWSRTTRFLHMGLATTVTLQLLLSLVMETPGDGRTPTGLPALLFEFHEFVGLAAFAVVLIHWGWSLCAADGGIEHLFPLGWAAGRAQIARELRELAQRRLPEGGPRGGLPGLVHGLGLLAVTAMAVTGVVIFALLPEYARPSATAHGFMEVHSFLASFVWAYWVGHVALALLHQRAGHATLSNMFRLSDR